MEALGRSRAAHYFAEFRQDYKAFRGGIEPGKAMAEGQRQEAHRLAGSAAVLGLAQLNACLGALERAEGTDWDSAALDEAWAQAEQILDRAEAA
jgi:HPt (histidine-containing phosphotransfer) domain-containing protein